MTALLFLALLVLPLVGVLVGARQTAAWFQTAARIGVEEWAVFVDDVAEQALDEEPLEQEVV